MPVAFAPERIETWPIERLQPYAKNAKVHDLIVAAGKYPSLGRIGLHLWQMASSAKTQADCVDLPKQDSGAPWIRV